METRRPLRAALVLAAALAVLRCRGEGDGPPYPPGPLAVAAVTRAARDLRASGRPVLFVGWDGADWQLLDLYMADGAMPNLAALVREGRSGGLLTIQPPLSPLVWTTMMTGVSPLVHGILDFTRFNPQTGQREPITRAERRVPALWNMAGMAGRSAAVFGLWATWPAEPVDGLLVSDRLFSFQTPETTPPPGVVYPPAEEAWARDALAATEKEVGFAALRAYLPWLTEDGYRSLLAQPDPYAQPAAALRRILVETAVYDRLAKGWLARHRPDLTVVYFQGSDAIGHVFAPYAPPRQPAVPEADFARYSAVPRAYFADLDRRLGEYRQIARRMGAVLMLASDHGFRWQEGRPERLASAAAATAGRWHREEGIYLLWGSGIAAHPDTGGHGERGSVTQVAATLLALLGLPPGEGLAGPALPGTPSQAPGTPVRYAAWFQPGPPAPATSASGGSEEVAKLKALGYVGASEPAQTPVSSAADATRTAGSFDNEGLLLRAAGRQAEARAAFEQALARDPGNAAALANLSDLLAQGPTPADRERADALLVQALAAGLPDGVERVLTRAAADRRAGAPKRGLALLDRTIAARPERPEPRLLRGRLRLERQDCRGALADFTAVTAAAPRNALAWGSAALARLCLGDRAGAVRDLRQSLALDPNQPEIARALAQIGSP
ncbi:MAG TPA: alkaline phosphatase family protein [Thermoanaerobaculia bacterium]|nr:alkaline phosphatase family protein [Thermoanaerobaculia bacterium]